MTASSTGEGVEERRRRHPPARAATGDDEAEWWVASRVQAKGRSEPARKKRSDPAFLSAWLGGLFLHRLGQAEEVMQPTKHGLFCISGARHPTKHALNDQHSRDSGDRCQQCPGRELGTLFRPPLSFY